MIFDGREFAEKKEIQLKAEVEKIKKSGVVPKLVSILADNSKETELYVSLKAKFAQRIGAIFDIHHFDGASTLEIVSDIKEANKDNSVHGIMVQLPVLNEHEILPVINPQKDVDCLTAVNLGLIALGRPKFLPATVKATVEVIKFALSQTENKPAEQMEDRFLSGKNVCVVGASIIVGKPLSILLSDLGATVTICRSTTKNLSEFTKGADILVSATGVIDLINKEMVKEGAIVIDVGISKLLREGKFRVVGDVNENVLAKTSFLTPVPGGIGPVTVASLFENLLSALRQGL